MGEFEMCLNVIGYSLADLYIGEGRLVKVEAMQVGVHTKMDQLDIDGDILLMTWNEFIQYLKDMMTQIM